MPLLEMITAGPSMRLSAFDSSVERQRWTRGPSRIGLAPIELALAQIMVLGMVAVDLRGIGRHGAIEVDRQIGNSAGLDKHLKQVDQLLGSAYGERGHEHDSASLDRSTDDFGERVEDRSRWMVPITIGTFADQIVARRRRRGIAIKRPIVPANIAGEQDS